MKKTFAVGLGGAAGQGVATPGDTFAKIFSREDCTLMLITLISRSSAVDIRFSRSARVRRKSPIWGTVWIC